MHEFGSVKECPKCGAEQVSRGISRVLFAVKYHPSRPENLDVRYMPCPNAKPSYWGLGKVGCRRSCEICHGAGKLLMPTPGTKESLSRECFGCGYTWSEKPKDADKAKPTKEDWERWEREGLDADLKMNAE